MARRKTDIAATGSKPGAFKYRYAYLAVFFALIIAYVAEGFIPKPDKRVLSQFHLTTTGYYWLVDPLIIVLVAIWLASLYGSMRVKSYARLISNSRDGAAIDKISNGLLILTMSLPLTSNIAYVLNHIARNHSRLQPTMTIVINYISLALMAAAFISIARGSNKLFKLIPGQVKQLPQMAWQGLFILAGSLYGYFIVAQPIHTPLARRAYYLPDWLLVLTIAAPYMFFWYLGVRGAYNIYLYRANISGQLYKGALNFLAAGIFFVVLGSVLTRMLTSISTTITNLKLTPLLLVIYGLLSVIATGYILIAIGAQKLRRIEEA
jgi:hypothetical protein